MRKSLFSGRRRASMQGWGAVVLALGVFPVATAAQSPGAGFTADDLLDVATVRIADLSDDGRWVAVTSAALRNRIGIDNARFGDPSYVAPSLVEVWAIDARSGEKRSVLGEKRQVQDAEWSPDGSRLALLARKGEAFEPLIWERATGRIRAVRLPSGKVAAENAELLWSADGGELILAVRDPAWSGEARRGFEQATRGPIVVLSSEDPFLAWESLRRLPLRRSLVAVDLASGRSRELLPETLLRSYGTAGSAYVSYLEDVSRKTDYDVIFGSENQLRIVPGAGGESRLLLASTGGRGIVWSREGRHFAYPEKGGIFFGSAEGGEPRRLTGEEPDSARDEGKRETFAAVHLSPGGERLVASSKQGLWLIDTASGQRTRIVESSDEDPVTLRYEVLDWSPDGESLFLSFAGRDRWERGVIRYQPATGRLEELFRDGRMYSDFRLSRDGSTWTYVAADGNRPGDVYAADAGFREVRRLTDANPWLARKALGKTELISYRDVDGRLLNGVLYYPVGHEPGKRYPTVFNLYEQFLDDRFSGTITLLNASGYAVVQPSVRLETGYPGEAWMKGVTSAANRVIEMGIADPDRLGVQGTSYGGYATNLLITQTDRFKAAINISGKVNMVSFYTDSPRLGVRNVHAPEKSQDRIGATLWEQPQKYIAHSAVMFADRIDTPLLLMTGEQDHNVPARQAMEMYYALRRLGKRVEWVNYVNGGHGMPTSTVEEVKDYHQRIVGWYDRHLKGGAPSNTDPEVSMR